MSNEITKDSHYIKPHSVSGESVEIITRHPESPHLRQEDDCNFKVYSFRSQDNTRVKILRGTDEHCIGDASTKQDIGSKLTGKKVLIISKDRKSISKPKKIPDSGTHNTNQIISKEFTYCELHEEYSHILNSKSYMENHKAKSEIQQTIINKTAILK